MVIEIDIVNAAAADAMTSSLSTTQLAEKLLDEGFANLFKKATEIAADHVSRAHAVAAKAGTKGTAGEAGEQVADIATSAGIGVGGAAGVGAKAMAIPRTIGWASRKMRQGISKSIYGGSMLGAQLKLTGVLSGGAALGSMALGSSEQDFWLDKSERGLTHKKLGARIYLHTVLTRLRDLRTANEGVIIPMSKRDPMKMSKSIKGFDKILNISSDEMINKIDKLSNNPGGASPKSYTNPEELKVFRNRVLDFIDNDPATFRKTKVLLRKKPEARRGRILRILKSEANEELEGFFETSMEDSSFGKHISNYIKKGEAMMPSFLSSGEEGVPEEEIKENYTRDEIYQLAKRTAPAGTKHDDILKMAAIGFAESSGNPRAHNACTDAKKNPKWTKGSKEPKYIGGRGPGCKNYGNSYGLWQINMIGDEEGTPGFDRRDKYGIGINEDLFDPRKNAEVAWKFFQTLGTKPWNVTSRMFRGELNPTYDNYIKILKDLRRRHKPVQEGIKIMNRKDLQNLVKEVLNENSGQGYAPYPYGSSVRDEEQPENDYIEDWKAFCMRVVEDLDARIEIAKILVKDKELFEDVLDLAGQNQSIGQEILAKIKQEKEENM